MNKITEKSNKSTNNIDSLDTSKILEKINEEDRFIQEKIKDAIPDITRLIDDIVNSFNNNGRLYYIGCGTSGRLGILDAVECPPTFSTPEEMVQGIIAGGKTALFKSIENAEDSKENAIDTINSTVTSNDVVVAISASGSASYVIEALKQAKKINAVTSLITCNQMKKNKFINHLIQLLVGPEIITGSTRMKAGTATKMVLNMITTTSMIKINKTYGNLMVDLKVSNKKLLDRAIRIVKELTDLSYIDSAKLLNKAQNNVKVAVVMKLKNISFNKSVALLLKNNGNLRSIID